MATKKQKRAAGLAKREKFLKEEEERGLAAQKADRERRAKQQKKIDEITKEISHRYQVILARAGIYEQ